MGKGKTTTSGTATTNATTNTNQTETANQQSTTTSKLPDYMTAASQTVAGNVAAAPAQTAYGGQMAAGQTAAQQQATQTAQANTGQATGVLMNALAGGPAMQTSAPTVVADAIRAGGDFDASASAKYMDPYLQAVQKNTVADMKYSNAMELEDLKDVAQANKAFGGAREALLQAEMRGKHGRDIMSYLDRSNSDAFRNSADLFQRDRQHRFDVDAANQGANLQARTTSAALMDAMLGRNVDSANAYGDRGVAVGSAISNAGAQDVRNLLATGTAEQLTNQAALDAAYNDFLRLQTAPLDDAAKAAAALGALPTDKTVSTTGSGTSTTTGTSNTNATTTEKSKTKQGGGLMNSLLGAAQIGASLISDPRLKRDARLLRRLANGLGVYVFRYVWERVTAPLTVGVMADEVARLAPAALGRRVAGYRTVDYSKLGGAL